MIAMKHQLSICAIKGGSCIQILAALCSLISLFLNAFVRNKVSLYVNVFSRGGDLCERQVVASGCESRLVSYTR
jgi:hypothetical protein